MILPSFLRIIECRRTVQVLFIVSLVSRQGICGIIHQSSSPPVITTEGSNLLNVSLNDFTSHNISSTLTLPGAAKCGTPYRWFNPLFDTRDCDGALGWLYLEELNSHDLFALEFTQTGVTPQWKLPQVQTPRKYTFSR